MPRIHHLTFVVCLLSVQLDAYDVFIAQTGNYLRCRNMCMYQEACNHIHFKNKRCLLITDPETSHGVKVNKPVIIGNVCDEADVCVPTGIVAPGYRHQTVLGVDLIGLKGFKIYTTGINFDGAKEYCANQGGQLFVVETLNQWQTIVKLVKEDDILGGTGLVAFWINGDDRATPDTYVTTSGEPMPFVAWSEYQPSYTSNRGTISEDCVELRKEYNYHMNDANCLLVNRGFICEWELF